MKIDERQRPVVVLTTNWYKTLVGASLQANEMISIITKKLVSISPIQDVKDGTFAMVLVFDSDVTDDMKKYIADVMKDTEVLGKIDQLLQEFKKTEGSGRNN